jgi:GT2 family glycosyltransferase
MGFAFACNQAIKLAKGKYILLLNPDTVIREDSISQCIDFMNENQNAGALGVKMINGDGKFLPESKRSLPTAKSAFYKMFGFSALFPKSKIFGKYQLQYLDENKIHEIEVLSGAFMFIRKEVLDKIGLLDENFFMYGEDIDLSYRILQAGYKNYYFPRTTIIHYKGESTKKASFKYVKIFYNAMLIFANKHYKGPKQILFRLLIRVAIYLRAIIALIKRFFSAIYLPALDFITIFFGYYLIIPLWEQYKFSEIKAYPEDLMQLYVPTYILIWQAMIFYFTRYDLKSKFAKLVKAIIWGTIVILTVYSLLPENYRYSRALIIFGALLSTLLTGAIRIAIQVITEKGFAWSTKKRAILVGHFENSGMEEHVDSLNNHFEICKQLKIKDGHLLDQQNINLLEENIKIYKIETIIFFIKDLSARDIINSILKTADKNLEFKIVLPESSSMVGTKSVIDLNKIPHLNISPITKPTNKFKKRAFDIIFSIIAILFSPFFLIKNNAKSFFKIVWLVFTNKMTWVSYVKTNNLETQNLPTLKPGVFSIALKKDNTMQKLTESNQNYAKDYRIVKDIIAIFKALKLSINLLKHINN